MTFLIQLIIALFLFSSCHQENQGSLHLSKNILKKVYPAIVEVVVPKREDKNIQYARPLPFDKLDFNLRNDKYYSIGTAFFVSPQKLASAAHVFGFDSFSLWKDFYIRSTDGSVHKVKKIYKYDQYRDYIEFDLESYPIDFGILKKEEKTEIGDMVYAVGNAQGEGISTRGRATFFIHTRAPRRGLELPSFFKSRLPRK